MANVKLGQIQTWLKTQVSSKRFNHIAGVVKASEQLARKNNISLDAARLAAWLHDSAKECTKDQMLTWIKGTTFQLDPLEKKIPALWHPHAGAGIALKMWNIKNKFIHEAIRCHTLGSPTMHPLAQVVFVADFIEAGRSFQGVDSARKVARKNLKEGVRVKCQMTLKHLLDNNMQVHPRLLDTWNTNL